MQLHMRRPGRSPSIDAEALALKALSYLADDPQRLGAFLAATGLGPESVRAAASDPGFLPAVLDHLIGNETALLEFAAAEQIDPAAVVTARNALAGAQRH
jgi:hypothetical protein